MGAIRKVAVCVALLAAGMICCSVAVAQLPTPTMHFSADYFTDTLGKADGASLSGVNWVDEVAGVVATPFGADMSIETGEAFGNPTVRANVNSNHWWISETEMDKVDGLLEGSNDYTIIGIVRDEPGASNTNLGIVGLLSGGGVDHQFYVSTNDGNASGGYQRTFQAAGSSFNDLANLGLTDTDVNNNFNAFGWINSGGTLTNFTNGITSPLQGGGYINDLGQRTPAGSRVMDFGSTGGGSAFRDQAEFIFYDRALDAQDKALVAGYLRTKYNIPIPEPTGIALAVAGLAIISCHRRRRC